mmetsp:Transcript_21612/g.56367  ORF Transcript_21612/g.56367 Transcript_21612/m.56367 type:complete len:276 (-) Transcript_21612:137-964(-)
MGSAQGKVVPAPANLAARAELGEAGVDQSDQMSVSEVSAKIRKVRGDIADTSTLIKTNQQNADILRAKVAEMAAARVSDEKELTSRLQKLTAELEAVKSKTVPEWVSTVDTTTGLVYFMNTKTKNSQWRAPPNFDGTFVLCDDVTGFIASTRLGVTVGDGKDDAGKASGADPGAAPDVSSAAPAPTGGRNGSIQRMISDSFFGSAEAAGTADGDEGGAAADREGQGEDGSGGVGVNGVALAPLAEPLEPAPAPAPTPLPSRPLVDPFDESDHDLT